jgi:putative molybdopterin biosynthesis protein
LKFFSLFAIISFQQEHTPMELLTAEDVAKQLKIKKYTVYELIKRKELPSSKVGKRIRVSQTDINQYLESRKTSQMPVITVPEQTVLPIDPYQVSLFKNFPQKADGPIIIGGQDICLELLVSRIAAAQNIQILRSYIGSYNGLYAFYNDKISMTAAHLWDGETNTYNYPFVRRLLPGLPVGVLRLTGRLQGFYVKKGNPLGIQDWKDFFRQDVTMINRERGCGTRILLDQKLQHLGIHTAAVQGYQWERASHLACATVVAKGGADVGCGCEQAAEEIPGIDFIPKQLEWYDFIFRLADQNTPVIQEICSYVSSSAFRQDLEIMGKYDLSQTGRYEEF